MKLQEKFMMKGEVTLILEAEVMTFERNLKKKEGNEKKKQGLRLRKNSGE